MGPTCIVFYCAFKVRGLVGISFWSMAIVVASGVIGRYIYIQILKQERETASTSDKVMERLEKFRQEATPVVSTETFESFKIGALNYVGLPGGAAAANLSLTRILIGSLWGDIRLLFSAPPTLPGWPEHTRYLVARYAVSQRQKAFLAPFRKMLGYWHVFHLPFAIFMYIAAVIHIVAALMFGIGG